LLGQNENPGRSQSKGNISGLAKTQTYGSKRKIEKTSKIEDKYSFGKDSPNQSPHRIIKTFRTQTSEDVNDLSSTIPVEGGPITSRQIEQILSRHKEIMMDVNFNEIRIEDILHRLKHYEESLARAKYRSLQMELSLNEMIEIVLLYLFTKGDLIENKTSPEILLKSVQKLVGDFGTAEESILAKKLSKIRKRPMDYAEVLEHDRNISEQFNLCYEKKKQASVKLHVSEKASMKMYDYDALTVQELLKIAKSKPNTQKDKKNLS